MPPATPAPTPTPYARATRIVASDAQVSAELDQETVILSTRDGVYFGLDGVGTRVWALVQSPTTLGAIVEVLVAEFEVAADTAFADLVALVADLEANGLVTTSDPAATA